MPFIQKTIAVLWPSFLVAGAATVIFFTLFDPMEIGAPGNDGIGLDRLGAYTIGFFLFWILMALSSLLTIYFMQPCNGRTDGDTRT